MIEETIIITLMIILNLKIKTDHMIIIDSITIPDIIIGLEVKKEFNQEIDIEAITEAIITGTDTEANP